MGAILGASEHCVAVHPSDLAVALVLLDAEVEVASRTGSRTIPIADFHRLPGETPHLETTLAPDELVTAVTLPAEPLAVRSRYRKVRDRASYAFALVSVAAALEVTTTRSRRCGSRLGEWPTGLGAQRLLEEHLTGRPATDEEFATAARAELAQAVGGAEHRVQDRARRAHDHRDPAAAA